MGANFSFHYSLRVAILLIATFCLKPDFSMASHAAGASITYTHVGGNTYRIKYTLYRDCHGIAAPGSVIINVSSISCGLNSTQQLIPINGTGQDISIMCPGQLSTCDGGTEPGFEKWEYENDFAIPAQCADWVFTYGECCRNGCFSIQQGSSNLTVQARLNNITSDNNSPQFTNEPFLFPCVNQQYHYNNGMLDADGDSLVYRLADAIGAVYIPPYSGQNPLMSIPPASFDSFTGDFVMFPVLVECGPVVFEVLDYRNGELMGSVLREIMMYTVACSNFQPTATGMNGTSQQIAYVFPNDTICFDIFTDDLDAADSVTLSWNQSIPAATFTTTTGLHPTGTFCWTPSPADVRPQPYMFTAMATDNNCPSNFAGIYSYFIYVTLDSALVFLNISNGQAALQVTISPNPSTGVFSIQSDEKIHGLKVFNSLGICVVSKQFSGNFSIADQSEGIYTVELQIDHRFVRKKIILSR